MNQTSLRDQVMQLLEKKKQEKLQSIEPTTSVKVEEKKVEVDETPLKKPVRKRRKKVVLDDDDD